MRSQMRAGRREWVALAVLALPVLLLSLDISVLLLALPELTRDLAPSSTQQLWITDIYGFTLGGFLITMGTLGDRIGRRRLLLTGAAAFGACSCVAAYAQNPAMLIGAWALLGVAGATIMPSTLGLVATMFRDARQRESAIATVFGCFLVGGSLGPVLGGVLLRFFWWGSVFLIGVPVMVLLLVIGPRLLPESDRDGAGRIDAPSVALSLGSILLAVYGIKALARDGWQPAGLATLVAGVALGAVFLTRQRRLAEPLVDLSLFGRPEFRIGLTLALFGGVIIGGTFLFATQYLQLVEGLAPLAAGLWMLCPTLSMALGTVLGPGLAHRVRPVWVIGGGLALSALGYLIMTQVPVRHGSAVLMAGFALAMFGMGLPGGLGINLIIGSVPPQMAGAASGISSTGQELGVALGLATLGSLGTAVYRGHLPTGLAPDVAARTRQGLAGAASVADRTPGLLTAARDAFTTGLHIIAAVGSVVLVLLALLVVATLRRIPSS